MCQAALSAGCTAVTSSISLALTSGCSRRQRAQSVKGNAGGCERLTALVEQCQKHKQLELLSSVDFDQGLLQ